MDKNKKARTLKEIALEAYQVQDASNLCGISQAFARAMIDLQPFQHSGKLIYVGKNIITESEIKGCIIKIWLDKLVNLATYQNLENCSTSFRIVADFAKIPA